MSKVKQWATDTAEQAVDTIIANLKSNMITQSTAIKEILDVENVELVGIDDENVYEVIDMELASANVSKADLLQENA
jgi:tRNA G26 N,N-dimethylase Trm1